MEAVTISESDARRGAEALKEKYGDSAKDVVADLIKASRREAPEMVPLLERIALYI